MQRSIAARYAARPSARFATVTPRAREPLLGLGRHARFRTGRDRPTLLARPETGPVALRRTEWRTARPCCGSRAPLGLAGSRAAVRWATFGVRPAGHRVRTATAPWRA